MQTTAFGYFSICFQSLQVGMLRSDYMLDTAKSDDLSLSQVEVNTIAASFAGLASKIAPTHRYFISSTAPLYVE